MPKLHCWKLNLGHLQVLPQRVAGCVFGKWIMEEVSHHYGDA